MGAESWKNSLLLTYVISIFSFHLQFELYFARKFCGIISYSGQLTLPVWCDYNSIVLGLEPNLSTFLFIYRLIVVSWYIVSRKLVEDCAWNHKPAAWWIGLPSLQSLTIWKLKIKSQIFTYMTEKDLIFKELNRARYQ